MTDPEIILERSFYIGNYFSGILYGIQLVMFFQSVYFLLYKRKQRRKSDKYYVAFGFILAVLLAIASAANAVFGQLTWIEHRDVPGGPAAFFNENTSQWYNVFGSAADVTANCMGDALLLYRTYIILGCRLWLVVLPAFIYLASTAMAIVATVASALPNAFFLQGNPTRFGVPWVALTVTFNMLVTIMISTRLLIAQRQMKGIVSPEYAKMYTGITAILVESALPFSILGIAFVVLYAKNNPAVTSLSGVWGSFAGISPQLIILRIAMGLAWNEDTLTRVQTETQLQFAPQLKSEALYTQESSSGGNLATKESDGTLQA